MTERVLTQRGRLITHENSRWWTLGAMCFALFMIMLDNNGRERRAPIHPA